MADRQIHSGRAIERASLIFDNASEPGQIILNYQLYEFLDVGYSLAEALADKNGQYVQVRDLWSYAYDGPYNPRTLHEDLHRLHEDFRHATRSAHTFIEGQTKAVSKDEEEKIVVESYRLVDCDPLWTSENDIQPITPQARIEIDQRGGIIYLNERGTYVSPANLRLLTALPQPAGMELKEDWIRKQVFGEAGKKADLIEAIRDLDSMFWFLTGEKGLITLSKDRCLSTSVKMVWKNPKLLRDTTSTYWGEI